jgi:hypothetical protein
VVLYRDHNSPLLFSVLSQINPVHALPSWCFNINFNIMFPSTSRSSKWSVSVRFTHLNCKYISLMSHSATCLAQHILRDFVTLKFLVRSTSHKAAHYAVLMSQMICPKAKTPCVMFCNCWFFMVRSCQPLAKPPRWRTTSCKLYVTLFKTWAATLHICQVSPLSAARGRTMLW